MAQPEIHNGGAEKAEVVVSFTAVKPQLVVEAPKASEAVQFYKEAFGAVETGRTTHPKRKAEQELPQIISAQLQLAGSTILVSDLADDSAPVKGVGSGLSLCLETQDVEAAVAKAVAAGAVAEGEIAESDGACCGGRVGKVKDPYGFVWMICSPSAAAAAAKCGDAGVEA
ncbi:unnamed protein product [Linum tenue]|uniref:VOC domain-containing protein n=1 Tax=Linum tenue TaxID=586396 RepID=A0AAV0KWC2_9ROSI|nr:unnamed protein product [Linum tenue]